MKQFLGLMKFEHYYYMMAYVAIAILSVVGVFAGPYGLQYIGSDASIEVTRFMIILFLAMFVFFISIILFGFSLHKSIQMKDMWLHSSASMYKLVGGKAAYHFIALLAMEGCLFIGFFFAKEMITGTLMQYVTFAFYSSLLACTAYIVVALFIFVGLTLNVQLAHYVKKFSIVLMLAAYGLFFWFIDYVPDLTFLQIGYVNLDFLNDYLPRVAEADYVITLFFNDFYIGSEIFSWFVVALIFMATCKWLERVLTR